MLGPHRVEHTVTDLWSRPRRAAVVRLCASITGDRDVAEDLAQETLLEAWRNREKLHDSAGIDRWLAAIARNICLRWARAHGRERGLVERLDPELVESVPDRELEHAQLNAVIEAALQPLSPLTRAAVIGRFVHELSHEEIGSRLNLSRDAVAMRLSRARPLIGRHLREATPGVGDSWEATRVWCLRCGARRLEMRRTDDEIAFRCRGCGRGPSTVFDLRNPFFRHLLDGLVRPAAILTRGSRWTSDTFAPGARVHACDRCSGPLRLARLEAAGGVGLGGSCARCGTSVWSSLHGLAATQPAVRALRRLDPRTRVAREQTVERAGRQTTVIRFEACATRATVDVLVASDSLRVLAS